MLKVKAENELMLKTDAYTGNQITTLDLHSSKSFTCNQLSSCLQQQNATNASLWLMISSRDPLFITAPYFL